MKILVKSRSLESHQTKIKNENCRPGFIDSVHKRYWKSATSLTPQSGTQFPILNVLESLIPKDQKKCNNTEMKSGRLLTAATQHWTPAVVNIKILVKSRSPQSNQTKIKKKIADPVLLSLKKFIKFINLRKMCRRQREKTLQDLNIQGSKFLIQSNILVQRKRNNLFA